MNNSDCENTVLLWFIWFERLCINTFHLSHLSSPILTPLKLTAKAPEQLVIRWTPYKQWHLFICKTTIKVTTPPCPRLRLPRTSLRTCPEAKLYIQIFLVFVLQLSTTISERSWPPLCWWPCWFDIWANWANTGVTIKARRNLRLKNGWIDGRNWRIFDPFSGTVPPLEIDYWKTSRNCNLTCLIREMRWSAHEPGQPKELPEFWAHHQRNVQCKESRHMKSYRLLSFSTRTNKNLAPIELPGILTKAWKGAMSQKKGLFFFPGFLLFTINRKTKGIKTLGFRLWKDWKVEATKQRRCEVRAQWQRGSLYRMLIAMKKLTPVFKICWSIE